MMYIISVDATKHFEFIFNFISACYNALMSFKISAFGFEFSLFSISVSFVFLVVLIKFLKFGFETESSSVIGFARSENSKQHRLEKHNDYVPVHAKKEYIPKHNKE